MGQMLATSAQHKSQSINREPSLAKLFSLNDVTVQFNELTALKNIQFTLNKGEIVFVTGASGAGKTTLLRVIAGDQDPTSGRVMRPTQNEIFISQVYQDLRILIDETCYENLLTSYDPNIYKNRKEFESDLNDLCRFLGITDRLSIKMRFANGGLKQKVAIIRSLLTKPDVFIADEPTSSLDADNARKIFDVLNLYNVKRGLTIVWASHNRELIRSLSGRIVHLDSGRLVYSGHACFI